MIPEILVPHWSLTILSLHSRVSRSTIGIWDAITLDLKGPIHFHKKEGCMNSDIYCEQVLDKMRYAILYITAEYEKRGSMIMDR